MTLWRVPATPKLSKKKHLVFQIPDVHVGYHNGVPAFDPCVWDIGMQALKHYAPNLTHLVSIGDFGNWESLSHWAALRAEHIFLEEDIALVKVYLDEIDEICDEYGIKKVFVEGNHEGWATLLEAKYPQFRNVVNLKHRLLRERKNWTWIPNNHFFKLGKIHFTHGNYPGASDSMAFLKEVQKNVLYGHTHGHDVARHRGLAGEHVVSSSGCWAMIDPPPPYSKAKIPARWVHMFHLIPVRSNGLFQLDPHVIIDSSYVELRDGTEIRFNRAEVTRRMKRDDALRTTLRNEYDERFFHPGGVVIEPIPVGRTEYSARTRHARIVEKS